MIGEERSFESFFHYFDASTGPFLNLSDLSGDDAERELERLRREGRTFAAGRPADYMDVRRSLEAKAREQFVRKGGRPVRRAPHYMTWGPCDWLASWYPEGKSLSVPVSSFSAVSVSFTYGDLFPAMRVRDGKPYRGQVFTLDEMRRLIGEYGFPQRWNPDGAHGPERYIEVQVWDDGPLAAWRIGG
ncbi:hypothetical protein [Paenibacillus flagellatus]|uniref:Uncharacterized protein n=1 Tax=Paenibacillus flagellatus TaxID=2211139 RepID=A0A2V5L045_9BACL|nr:hypothetical protein [Paenibacillus flagellatus]PYI55916.1 hypothetical protein DLM86_09405 [Paenibacillus flagellatus]